MGAWDQVLGRIDRLERISADWVGGDGPRFGRCQELTDPNALDGYLLLTNIAHLLREPKTVPIPVAPGNPPNAGLLVQAQRPDHWVADREARRPVPPGDPRDLHQVLNKITHGDPLWYEVEEQDIRIDIAARPSASWICLVQMSILIERMRSAIRHPVANAAASESV